VDEVVPGVDVEDAEDSVDIAGAAEGGAVEEADDPGDQQDAADQDGVEAGGAVVLVADVLRLPACGAAKAST
jgi:hypothetical protein